MQLLININDKDYEDIMYDKKNNPRNLNVYERIMADGLPFLTYKDSLVSRGAIIRHIENGLNSGKYGHDAKEILHFVQWLSCPRKE